MYVGTENTQNRATERQSVRRRYSFQSRVLYCPAIEAARALLSLINNERYSVKRRRYCSTTLGLGRPLPSLLRAAVAAIYSNCRQ